MTPTPMRTRRPLLKELHPLCRTGRKKKSNCCVVMVVHFKDLLDVSEFWRKKIENVTSSTVARHVRFVGFTTIALSIFKAPQGMQDDVYSFIFLL